MIVEYSSNNSGGSWWLSTEDWLALEKAGWTVNWGGEYFCNSKYLSDAPKRADAPRPCAPDTDCPGHREFESLDDMTEKDYWLGTPAKNATKDVGSVSEALREFEAVTGQSVTDEGCNCCGAPHSFSWDGGYASGDDCSGYLYDEELAGLSKRELLEKLSDREAS